MGNAVRILGLASGLLLFATPAYAGANFREGDWYAGISGDLTWLEHSDTGGGGNIDLGYHFAPNMRLEAQVGYHTAAGTGGYRDTHYFTYLGNIYYDFKDFSYTPQGTGWRVSPYIGGGLGAATVSYGQSNFARTFHHHDTDFAYQGMAGLTFVADSIPCADWVLGYRYTGTAGGNNIEANNLEFGLRYHF